MRSREPCPAGWKALNTPPTLFSLPWHAVLSLYYTAAAGIRCPCKPVGYYLSRCTGRNGASRTTAGVVPLLGFCLPPGRPFRRCDKSAERGDWRDRLRHLPPSILPPSNTIFCLCPRRRHIHPLHRSVLDPPTRLHTFAQQEILIDYFEHVGGPAAVWGR